MTTIAEVITFLVRHQPGISEKQLAAAIFGAAGYQQRVNADCNLLLNRNVVQRRKRTDGRFGYYLCRIK